MELNKSVINKYEKYIKTYNCEKYEKDIVKTVSSKKLLVEYTKALFREEGWEYVCTTKEYISCIIHIINSNLKKSKAKTKLNVEQVNLVKETVIEEVKTLHILNNEIINNIVKNYKRELKEEVEDIIFNAIINCAQMNNILLNVPDKMGGKIVKMTVKSLFFENN